MEWIYNFNVIEGNLLIFQEIKLVLEEGIIIGGKILREYFEVMNYKDVIDYIEEFVERNILFIIKDILKVYGFVFNNIECEYVGCFRIGGVRIGGVNFVFLNVLKVLDLIDELL